MAQTIRIATRASALALWQSKHVAEQLARRGVRTELVKCVTQGDKITDRPLWREGGKALFVSALEAMLFNGEADIAVHSMKDMPTTLTPGMTLAAVLPRGAVADAFVSKQYADIDELPAGATVGTCSMRRRSQLLHQRPDIRCVNLRGNVDTRLAKLDAGELDAIVLACAGLERLDCADRVTARLPDEVMLPAIGQGAIGIECREEADPVMSDLLGELEDAPSRRCVDTERAFGRALNADCHSPVAARATLNGARISLFGMAASPDGQTILRTESEGAADDAVAVGETAAEELLAHGAAKLLAMKPEE